MLPLWKRNNPIYFGVIRLKVKVTVTMNIMFITGSFLHDSFSSVYWIFIKFGHMVSLWKGGESHLFWCHLVKGQRHRYYEYNF